MGSSKASYNGNPVPAEGQRIESRDGKFMIPDHPIIPFVEGDGTGRDIWKASRRVFDAAVQKAYGGKRTVVWYEVFTGEKAFEKFKEWLPADTIEALKEFRIGIKGPLTTPVGGGIRSLNVTLRQVLNLYACVRPVRYFAGVPSPVLHPERMNAIIFRENTEDVYAGHEWQEGTPEAQGLIRYIAEKLNKKIRPDSGIGIKPISRTGSQQLVRRAIKHALENNLRVVTLVHKGNIMKFTEGAFRDWGYELAKQEFRDKIVTERESWILDNKDKNPNLTIEQNAGMVEPGMEFAPESFRQQIYAEVKEALDSIYATHGKGQWKKKLMINDRIADSIFQQVVTRADEYQVLATPNLDGDFLSDACAAQIGGLGMAPGANIGDDYAVFEATHGTAPKYADKDVINPTSVILSGCMMFRFMGWKEVTDIIEDAIARTIQQKKVTYDLERLMEGATKLRTSEFATCIIENMQPVPVAA
ncbi:MAG: NADP-dependent isocitrate dehydrogenase [Acidobacteria bacterium]|nr:NADP-dependent isocitrate dehydrogenase [Acidobacteriota bacterium]